MKASEALRKGVIYANPGDHGCGIYSEEKSEGDKKYYSEDLIEKIAAKLIADLVPESHVFSKGLNFGLGRALSIVKEVLKDE